MAPKFYSRVEIAEILGVNVRTVDRYIADGTLNAVKVGPRMVRIPATALEALLTSAVSR